MNQWKETLPGDSAQHNRDFVIAFHYSRLFSLAVRNLPHTLKKRNARLNYGSLRFCASALMLLQLQLLALRVLAFLAPLR
jgi:hypothetical protein